MKKMQLIKEAKKVVGEFRLQKHFMSAGSVAAALVTKAGNVYTGICIDLACGIGFCAEHSAIAEMLKHRETEIKMIVAVTKHGIIPPCGRCREMIAQVDKKNRDTLVITTEKKAVRLKVLLPNLWFK
jgi:cytidine deaminase